MKSELDQNRVVVNDLNQQVNIIVAEALKISVEDITDNLEMDQVDEWDSLKHMELITMLEGHFGIQLTFEEIVRMKSVEKIKHVLIEKGTLS